MIALLVFQLFLFALFIANVGKLIMHLLFEEED